MEITRVGVKFWYVIKYFQIQCWFCQLLAIYKYIEFFFKCNLFSTLSYSNQRQVSALTMLTNVIKYISITLVLLLFMFDCLLFRSYIPYFCPRVCEGSHLHKIRPRSNTCNWRQTHWQNTSRTYIRPWYIKLL